MTQKQVPELSVVLPVFNEEASLKVLCDELTEVLVAEQELESAEIIFVDDGSQDNSAGLLCELARSIPQIKVVELARNFGHQVAISAGLDHSLGQIVVVMDSDMQDPPEVIPQLVNKCREGFDVVYAVRQKRKENWLKRLAYSAFYRVLWRVSDIEIPLDAGDFCAMDRRVVDLLHAMPERNRFIRGIRSWVGLRQTGVPYERSARHDSKPKYTLWTLLVLAIDGLISFSHAPLRLASMLGFLISALSFLMAAFYAVKRLTTGLNPAGFATLVVAIFFLAGIQLITIGVMGEYIARIFDEVKQRPLYVVRKVTSHADSDAGQ